MKGDELLLGPGGTVLAVDDQEENLELIEEILGEAQIPVFEKGRPEGRQPLGEPGIERLQRAAHDEIFASGRHTWRAPGSTRTLSFFTLLRSPPSTWYSLRDLSSMSIFRAAVISTYFALDVVPATARVRTRAHWVALVAVTTATSRRPSVGLASSKASMQRSAPRAVLACLAGLAIALLLVGVVSGTLLRHVVQILPLGLTAAILTRRPAWGAYAALPIFGF